MKKKHEAREREKMKKFRIAIDVEGAIMKKQHETRNQSEPYARYYRHMCLLLLCAQYDTSRQSETVQVLHRLRRRQSNSSH